MCNANDHVKAGKIMKYLDDKYGFKPTIDLHSSPNFKEDKDVKQAEDDNLDWWS